MTTRVLGTAIFLIAVVFLCVGSSYRIGAGDPVGPSLFPMLVSIPALALSGALIVNPRLEHPWQGRKSAFRLLIGIGCLFAYAFLLEPIGFLLATFLMFAGMAYLFGANQKQASAAAVVASPGLFILFDVVLGLPLPAFGEWIG
jgi:putative tricarboxylic transport membrane protein